MYKNEREFERALFKKLKAVGAIPYAIETGPVSPGIPDMFVLIGGDDTWIELKKLFPSNIKGGKVTVSWRPGQQAWALNYYRMHNKKKYTYTIACVSNSFIVIPMVKMYKNNTVDLHDCKICKTLSEVINEISKVEQSKFQYDD